MLQYCLNFYCLVFFKKPLTSAEIYDIIYYRKSGCGADGSALPWGGRGRWFKSSHSDQKSGVVRFPIFLYFTGFFGHLGVHTASKSSAIFFAQNRLEIGYDHMFDHICHEKAIYYKGFRHFAIFILCKMTAVLCSREPPF